MLGWGLAVELEKWVIRGCRARNTARMAGSA